MVLALLLGNGRIMCAALATVAEYDRDDESHEALHPRSNALLIATRNVATLGHSLTVARSACVHVVTRVWVP